jgi:very-short-patch-repair endonuclease/phage FluMu protein Com
MMQTKCRYPGYQYSITDGIMEVTCKTHGFSYHSYRPGNNNMYPCRACGILERSNKLTKPMQQYINQARAIHGGVYDYSIENDQIYAICKEHGQFLLAGNRKQNHINKMSGCPQCKQVLLANKYSTNPEQFIQQSNAVHRTKYSYTNIQYRNTHEKIAITCKNHGDFFQTPLNHLQGAGCPRCKQSHGELLLDRLLSRYKINFETQKTFPDCVNPKTQRLLRFDFYLVDYDVLIEVDGLHHFEPVYHNTKMDKFELFDDVQYRDNIKNEYALIHGKLLLRFPYTDIDNFEPLVYELIEVYK